MSGGVPTSDVAPPPAITCSVLGESRGRDMVFRGRIESRVDAAGSYRLVVAKTGPSGTSHIAQGGTFTVVAGDTRLVGSMTVSVEAGAQVEATLQVTADGRTADCQPFQGDRT